MSVELGDTVKDTITGFVGVVVGVHEYLWGCRRMSVQGKELENGKPIDTVALDEPQLEIIEEGPRHPRTLEKLARDIARTGGPHQEPRRTEPPAR